MQSGTINVQTENIFPVIKKFLYSDHEIFLRELVSNAVDATQKLKTLSSIGEFKGELGALKVEVILNKEAKTITIRDNGIGMTQEEIEKYINQIAFSGAEEFVEKYKDKGDSNAIIGHFGLGFYSSFMVAANVEILTKSFKDSPAVKWECDGSPNFTIEEIEKTERGTDIVLHVAEDSTEFLEESRLSTILNKYCKFLPVDIIFGTTEETEKDAEGVEVKVVKDNIINNTKPAWTKAPSELKPEDYSSFYRELYPFAEEPLFHIHLHVDYPFNLTGILYFPKLKNNFEVQKNKIQLYSNQVFITDSVEEIVPDFLTLLHGVIDSPDIPLNVSRSYLQSDANVKKIASHITKKVADKLEDMFKNDRPDFEKKWNDIQLFIQYGMLSDEKFFDKGSKFALYQDDEKAFYTFDEFLEKVKPTQTDKDEKTVVLYTSDADEQHSFVSSATDRGYKVLSLGGPLASHITTKLEQKYDKISFARVDSDTIDKLINKEESLPSKLTKEEEDKLKPVIEGVLPAGKFQVSFESLSEKDQPVIITQSEFMRRMKEQQMMGGGMNIFGNLPDSYNMVINSNHPLVSQILAETESNKQIELVKQLTDLALLAQNMLKGKDLTDFVKRSIAMIGK